MCHLRSRDSSRRWPEAHPERARLLFDRAKAHFLGGGDAPADLFEAAKRALLDLGDREAAAEAGTFEAMALWGTREANVALERASSAAALLEDAPASPTKGYVIGNWARYLFLAGRDQDALEVGQRALAMAEEHGYGEVRANALNTVGMARFGLGDLEGLEDLEESLRVAYEHSSSFEISRIYNNFSATALITGRVERASEVSAARLELDQRFGLPRQFGEATMASYAYWTGRWDEAARRADAHISESADESWELVLGVRAPLRLARDDLSGAAADNSRVLDGIGEEWEWEPWVGVEPYSGCAQVALATGKPAEAADLVEKIFALVWRYPFGDVGLVELALILERLGGLFDPVLEAGLAHARLPWLQAAAAVARGEPDAAADQLDELRCPPLESHVRLLAAERLVAEGRRAEADVQLRRALAFWRSVGATRYIREAETLLAATG